MAQPLEYSETDIDDRHGKERLIRWMMVEGFLWEGFNCANCGFIMRLERSKHFQLDGFEWRCPRSDCKRRRSIRSGSFFANSNLTLRKLMKLTVNFMTSSSARGAGLRYVTDRGCVGQYYKKVMTAFRRELAREPIEFTHGFEYEADELYLRHVLGPNGPIQKQWIAGILERQTGKCIYYRVDDRSIDSLIPPIVLSIPNGSLVYTDEWPSYVTLGSLPFLHRSVNHSHDEYERWDNIGNFQVHVHINTLEGLNHAVRAKLKNHTSRSIEHIDLVLDEIMYRNAGRSLFDPLKVRFQ